MDDEITYIKASEWYNARDIYKPTVKPAEPPKVDPDVSKLVGHKIFTHDPRLIELVKKWRKNKDPEKPDNFLRDPSKVAELKKVFKHG